MGGGVGLVSICDYAIAVQSAFFALSEVKLGVIPAVISPHVVEKIGTSAAKRYFCTGESFSSSEAKVRRRACCSVRTGPCSLRAALAVPSGSKDPPGGTQRLGLVMEVAETADAMTAIAKTICSKMSLAVSPHACPSTAGELPGVSSRPICAAGQR